MTRTVVSLPGQEDVVASADFGHVNMLPHEVTESIEFHRQKTTFKNEPRSGDRAPTKLGHSCGSAGQTATEVESRWVCTTRMSISDLGVSRAKCVDPWILVSIHLGGDPI